MVSPERKAQPAIAAPPPRISVVMPNYNGAKYLAEAIASVLAQTYGDFELLVLDDGSTDGSVAIARGFDDPRVKVHALEHAGLAATLNRGIALAQGALIARMDSDDIARPNRFALQVAYLDAHPEVALVGGQVRLLFADGRVAEAETVPCNSAQLAPTLLDSCCIYHPTVMVRTEVLRAVGGYRSSFSRAEDYDLWLRLVDVAPLANLPEVVLDFRRHGESVSHVHRSQQHLDSLAARMACLTRRATRRDPFEGFAGPFDIATLVTADIPPEVRDEWTALAFMAVARHGVGPDTELSHWIVEAAYARLGPQADDTFRERMARAHFSLARAAYEQGRRIDAVTHVARAVSVAPRIATRRILRYARRFL